MFDKDSEIMMPIKSKIFKKKVWALDTEDDSKGHLIRIVLYNGIKFFDFSNDNYNFIAFLFTISKKLGRNRLYIACTNLEYDMINCFRGHFEQIIWTYGNRLIACQLKNTNIYFLDTLNHYVLSVKNQGQMLGLKKLKYNPVSLEYVRRDTEITYKFINMYQDFLFKMNAELKNTIASTSLNFYRRNFLDFKIKRLDNKVLDELSNAYYGGRSEIFDMRVLGNIIYADVNSLYPKVMACNKYPMPASFYYGKNIDDEGISKVEIEYIKDLNIPYYPYKAGKLLFPLGRMTGYWSNYELRYGIEKGFIRINKLYKSFNFSETGYVFKDYIEYLYGMRQKYINKEDLTSKFWSLGLKIIMNSSYGKFAEQVKDVEYICDSNNIVDIVVKDIYYPKHTNYIWSIYVTAYARTYMWEGYQLIENQGGKVHYTDTDSIIFSGNPDMLVISNSLGDYRIEGRYVKAQFYLPKTYVLIDNKGNIDATAKGVPRDKQEEFIRKHFVLIDKPIKLRESFRLKIGERRPNVWVKQLKSLVAKYDKRKVLSGGKTSPLVFPDDFQEVMLKKEGSDIKDYVLKEQDYGLSSLTDDL